jgi:hypothetical protein
MGCIQVVTGAKRQGGAAAGESFTTFMERLDQRFETLVESARVQAATITQMRGEYDEKFAESARVQAESARVQAAIIAESTRVQNEQQVTITQMRRDIDASFAHMEGRLDEIVRGQKKQREIIDQQRVVIDQQRVDIDALLQRNNDLTIDRGLIDELSGYRDEAVNAALSLNRAQALIDDLSTFRNWAMCPLCSQQERRDTICLPCNHTVCADCCIDHVCRVCLGHIENRLPLL